MLKVILMKFNLLGLITASFSLFVGLCVVGRGRPLDWHGYARAFVLGALLFIVFHWLFKWGRVAFRRRKGSP